MSHRFEVLENIFTHQWEVVDLHRSLRGPEDLIHYVMCSSRDQEDASSICAVLEVAYSANLHIPKQGG
jgi:hypothetical protein